MHQTVTATINAPTDKVTKIVGDLGTYPEWLELVTAAALATNGGDDRPTWLVTIRAKVGPFARAKKLRMMRTLAESAPEASTYRFERTEVDGRDHSAWTLDITVASTAEDHSTCEVAMDLYYDGGLWTAPLEPILGSFISGAGPDLEAYANRS